MRVTPRYLSRTRSRGVAQRQPPSLPLPRPGADVPAGLVDQLRSRGSGGDVHLVGGPRTIRAFQELGALDRLEILVLPILLGDGIPLSPRQAPPLSLRLLSADRIFPDGTAELVYTAA